MYISKMSDQDLIDALKDAFFTTYASSLEWARNTTEEETRYFPRNGIATYAIAKILDSDCSTVTPLYNKLVKKGLVLKDTSSTMNSWWPVGFLDEIRNSDRTASSS